MTFRRAPLAAVALVAVGLAPSAARAQKDPFIDALIAFRAALPGTYGDEGPQLAAAVNRMATSLAAWDREAAAAGTELRRGLSDAPPADQLRRRIALASLWLDRGQWAGALAELDAAIGADPDRAAVYLARGLVRETAGDTVGAASDFQRAWDLDRGDPVMAYLLVTRGLATGTLEDPGPPIDALLSAQRGATGGAPPGFMEIGLLRDRADWPVFAPAAYTEGFALVAAGRYSDALASFRDAVARDPLLIDPAANSAQMARGIASLRESQYDAAIEHLEAAVAETPASSEARRLLGTAYYVARRTSESLAQLGAAIRLVPSDERARIALARELVTGARLEEAEKALQETLAALPDSAEARWVLARLYMQGGRAADALVELEALASVPLLAGRGRLDWELSDLHRRQQDLEAETRALSERVRLDLNNPAVHKDLGLAHMKRGNRPQALAELLMTELLAPGDIETLVTIGQIHLDDERYQDAEVVLRDVVARDPDVPAARFALGTTFLRLGRTEEAREELAAFERLTALRREAEQLKIEFEMLLTSAERFVADGRLDEAMASLERAASIAGDEPRVYQLLASVYEKQGRTDERARALSAYERLLQRRAAEP